MAPAWLLLPTAATATLVVRARSIAWRMANAPAIWPMLLPPSITRAAPASLTTRGRPLRIDAALGQLADVQRHAHHAVRMDPAQIGLDQLIGSRTLGVGRRHAAALEDACAPRRSAPRAETAARSRSRDTRPSMPPLRARRDCGSRKSGGSMAASEGSMRSAFDLSGQRILITGAAGGIGEATARVCASLGAGCSWSTGARPMRLARQLQRGGRRRAEAFACDVTSRAEVEAVAAATGPVDALVLAAGICPWDDWQEPGWDEVFDQVIAVNLHGPIHFARACLPGMIERRPRPHGARRLGCRAHRRADRERPLRRLERRAARPGQVARQARRAPWRPGQRHRARRRSRPR